MFKVRAYSRHLVHGCVLGGIFFGKKRHFVCLHPLKTQSTRLGPIVAPNKDLEQALKVNHKHTRTPSATSFWYFYLLLALNVFHTSHLFLLFLLLTLSMCLFAGNYSEDVSNTILISQYYKLSRKYLAITSDCENT